MTPTTHAKSRFIVPNTFTAFSFLLGIYVILLATDALPSPLNNKINIIFASHLIVICALLDKLDGFAAKLLNASSDFGAQFDSLADLIAFGVAPAMCVIYAYQQFAPDWYANNQVVLMIFLSIYVLCAAIRLARYNATDSTAHPDWFVGLPSTFVGALNALTLILCYQYGFFREGSAMLLAPALMLIVTALFMVAPLYLPKLKVRKNKFINIVQIAGIATGYGLGFSMKYSEVILFLICAYAIIGLCLGIQHRRDLHDTDVDSHAPA
jgi:CDP-diacylglycerol--serine O-phosphatidyltransferase